jgi:hypothetical protein
MSERKISEMSIEELKLYQEQLSQELTRVNVALRQQQQIAASQKNSKETV